jgi:hypothetical protein
LRLVRHRRLARRDPIVLQLVQPDRHRHAQLRHRRRVLVDLAEPVRRQARDADSLEPVLGLVKSVKNARKRGEARKIRERIARACAQKEAKRR